MNNMRLRTRLCIWAALVAICMSGASFAAGPSIVVDSVRQRYPWNGLVDIDYTAASNMAVAVSGYDRAAGMPLLISSLSEVGSTNVFYATNGTHRLTWNAAADVPSFTSTNVEISIWSLPAYLVVDLATGATSALDAAPTNGWDDAYKTTKLALRRVDPGAFFEAGARTATLTAPYYVGVFELTRKQWDLVMGTATGATDGTLPAASVSYTNIRGGEDGALWPATNAVEASSFMGILRQRTGLVFDLPTEAQWEYACRAGTTNSFNNGSEAMDDVGWYYGNSGNAAHAVGLKAANAWGLYDMHGNVWEWCLDWYESPLGTNAVVDPVGAATGKKRLVRGGSYLKSAAACTSSNRLAGAAVGTADEAFGFRVACGSFGSVTAMGACAVSTLPLPREPAAVETVAYSPSWGAAPAACSVSVINPAGDSSNLVTGATAEGAVAWAPGAANGLYTLLHVAGGVTNTAYFIRGGVAQVVSGGAAFSCRFIDGKAYLTASNGVGAAGALTVPGTLLGCPVAGVLPGAFAGSSASSVNLPESVSGVASADVVIEDAYGAISVSNAVFTLDGATMGDSATATIRLRTSGNGRLSFRWNVSCESESDYAFYACDGAEVARRSYTTNDWIGTTNIVIDGADHEWTFSYKKDAEGAAGEDAAWFTGFAWQPAVTLAVTGGAGSTATNYPGDVVTIVANNPPSDSVFVGWSGDTGVVADVSAATTTITLPDHDIEVTANYHADSWLVTVNVVGGGPNVEAGIWDSFTTSYVQSAYCSEGRYAKIVAADLSFPAIASRSFAGWIGDTNTIYDQYDQYGSVSNDDEHYIYIEVPAQDVTLTAVYTNISCSVSVEGGYATSGTNSGAVLSVPVFSTVSIHATNSVPAGSTFSWFTASAGAVINDPLNRDASVYVTNSFVAVASYLVRITGVDGAGGTTNVAVGSQVVIAAPATNLNGQVFSHWLPLDAPVAGIHGCRTTLTVPATNYTLSAVYADQAPYEAKTTVESGLYSGVLPSDTSSSGSINEQGIPVATNRADYPVMACQALSDSFEGWGEKTNWVYWGQMQLEAGTNRFAECFDDVVLVMVGGKYVLRSRPDKNGERPEYGDFIAASNGWYDVRFVFYNNTGKTGARVRDDWGNANGLVYRNITDGNASTNYADYSSLASGTYRTVVTTDGDAFEAIAAFLGLPSGTVSGSGRKEALGITTNGVTFSGSVLGDGTNVSLAISTTGNGRLSFYWNVSSESGRDVFSYSTNGVVIAAISGKTNDWTLSENYVTDGGDRTWVFTYLKDSTNSFGADAAWLRDVVWTAGAVPPSSRTNTAYSAVSVPYAWLIDEGLVAATNTLDSVFEDAATNTCANGYLAWESYVAGLTPTNAASKFLAYIAVQADGAVLVTWDPDLGATRVYTVFGKTNLVDAAWITPTNSACHFFKVGVGMPTEP